MNTVTTATDICVEIADAINTNIAEGEAQEPVNSLEQRNKLFDQYLPLAQKIACKKHRDMPKCVQLEELKSAAMCGLLDAATKYQPDKHDQFPVYARIRILGEINDHLRRCTWGGRNRQFYGWSLDVPVSGSRGSRRPVPLDEGLTDVPEVAENEAEEFFMDLTKSLPQKVRNILRYYYLDGLTMKEISLIENLCESRVSQLMSHYKKVLQKIWAGKETDLWDAARPSFTKEKFRLNTVPTGPVTKPNGKTV